MVIRFLPTLKKIDTKRTGSLGHTQKSRVTTGILCFRDVLTQKYCAFSGVFVSLKQKHTKRTEHTRKNTLFLCYHKIPVYDP